MPYSTNLPIHEFLTITYKLMIRKVNKIIDIEKRNKGKLPLILLKMKFEETSKILKSISELIKVIDYSKPDGYALSSILNDIGLTLSKATIEKDKEKAFILYDVVKSSLEAFLGDGVDEA